MTATKPLGTYGNGVGTVTPYDHKMAQVAFFDKSTTANLIRPGLMYNGISNIVTGTAGMAYSVAAFTSAHTRGATSGVTILSNDGSVSVSTTAAPGSNSRIDVIYVWPREYSLDGVDSNPVIGVVQGTAAAVPTEPSLASFPGAIKLATATVASGIVATTSATITQTAPFTALDGVTFNVRNSTDLAAVTTAQQGDLARQLDNGVTYKWFNLYNASTNPTGRATAGWKPWETAVPVDYYSAGNLVNFTSGSSPLPVMTWTARSGRIFCEGSLVVQAAIANFTGGFSIKIPPTIPAAAKYNAFTRQDRLGIGGYQVSGTLYPADIVMNSTTPDRVSPLLEVQTGTYPTYATQLTAAIPVAQSPGYSVTWSFEYDPA